MVVSSFRAPAGVGNRSCHRTALNHNGQRSWALAVPDYESRALPLSYGGGGAKVSQSSRYTVLRRGQAGRSSGG
jgi:hypothetical protein